MFRETINLLMSATISLPAFEVTFLLVLLSCCLVFNFTRIGLIGGYLIVYRWGWVFFMGQDQKFLVAYLIFGCLAGVLTVIAMLRSPRPD